MTGATSLSHASACATDDRDGLGPMPSRRPGHFGEDGRGGREKGQDEVSETSGMRRRIVGKSAPVNEYVAPAEAPQFQPIGRVCDFLIVARSQEVVDAGVTGETYPMGA